MWKYITTGELYHHGVKGMKWGTKNGPPYPLTASQHSSAERKAGTSGWSKEAKAEVKSRSAKISTGTPKPNGKTHGGADLAKKLADGKLDTDVKLASLDAKYKSDIAELNKERPKDDEWFREKGNMRSGYTDKARAYLKKSEEIYENYSKEESKLYRSRSKEVAQLRKKAFLNDELKQDVTDARQVLDQMDKARDEIVGENSPAAKAAYKKYLNGKQSTEESEYGFYHYKWREGNPDYDRAYSDYKNKTKSLSDDYNKRTTEIGKKAFGDYATMKMNSKTYNTYADFGKAEADNLIRFRLKDYGM